MERTKTYQVSLQAGTGTAMAVDMFVKTDTAGGFSAGKRKQMPDLTVVCRWSLTESGLRALAGVLKQYIDASEKKYAYRAFAVDTENASCCELSNPAGRAYFTDIYPETAVHYPEGWYAQDPQEIADAALIVRSGREGLDRKDMGDLMDKTGGRPFHTVEIVCPCRASGFEVTAEGIITAAAAEQLDSGYGQESAFGSYICAVLNSPDEKPDDGIYRCRGLKVWISGQA